MLRADEHVEPSGPLVSITLDGEEGVVMTHAEAQWYRKEGRVTDPVKDDRALTLNDVFGAT